MQNVLENGTKLILKNKDQNSIEYTITGLAGKGASCVVYEAERTDSNGLKHKARVKEFCPVMISFRNSLGEVCPKEGKEKEFSEKLIRFEEGYESQVAMRNYAGLTNSIINAEEIYAANGTKYIVTTYAQGSSLDKDPAKTLYGLLKIARSTALAVDQYHKRGLLHLDIKPANIFRIPETDEMIMLFDFDSALSLSEIKNDFKSRISCSPRWAAPELKNGQRNMICLATDLYSIGAMVFDAVFNREITSSDRSMSAKWEYKYDCSLFENVNPKVFLELTEFFHRVLSTNTKRRYQSAAEMVGHLDQMIKLADPKEPYLKSSLPPAQAFFVGREREIAEIHQKLDENKVLFVSGIGGIGKSELVKKYANEFRYDYSTIIFTRYENNSMESLIVNDEYIPIYNFYKNPSEELSDYCTRKIEKLKELCDENTLFIVDNFDKFDSDIDRIINLGVKVLITTRLDFSDYNYNHLFLDALEDRSQIYEVFGRYYTKVLSEEDQTVLDEIIDIVKGHTMTVELLAKQMMAGRVKPEKMLAKLQEGGITESGKEKIRIGKDQKLLSGSSFEHIRDLFDLNGMSDKKEYVLTNLSLIPLNGMETNLFAEWCKIDNFDVINELITEGWIKCEKELDYISLHPLISDILRDKISFETVGVLISKFAEALTDDETGEVILETVPFAFANELSMKILRKIRKGQIETNEEVIHCILKFGDFFLEQSLFEYSEEAYRLAEERYKKMNCSDSYLKLAILNNLALLYDKLGELHMKSELSRKAILYFIECLSIVENTENNLIEYVGTINGNLGSVYHSLKEYETAERYYKKALETVDRYSYYTLLGTLYKDVGEFHKGVELQHQALEKAEKYNEPPLVIALIEHNMAVCYSKLKLYDVALVHSENAVNIREKYLNTGESYDLALSKSLLGQILIIMKIEAKRIKANELLSDAMTLLEKTVGASHYEYKKAKDAFELSQKPFL